MCALSPAFPRTGWFEMSRRKMLAQQDLENGCGESVGAVSA
jgi:hypothetical protein